MATQAEIKASNKYNKENTKAVVIRLNIHTDWDILAKLDEVESKAGYIKSLIRADIKTEQPTWTHEDGYLTDGEHIMTYGDYGRDTWGLHLTVDGKECTLLVRGSLHPDGDGRTPAEQANELIAKLESGWRPVNWR